MAMYESEHTRFMREWMRQHPEEARQQQAGRALWWDKPQDLERTRRDDESSVPRLPYAYGSGQG
jgi:hypothetical protein